MRHPKLLTTLRTYNVAQFRADCIAGFTVAMVALPLSLAIAIAIASGAPPSTGLVTAIVGGFLVSALGGSRVQIGGPTGAFIVVVFGVIAEHGLDGLVLATFMAGFILLVAGYFRAGRLIAFVPEAVVNGFTIGIAIIIATSQIKDLVGLDVADLPADFLQKLPVLWAARESANAHAFALAVLVGVAIVALRRLAPRFPGLIVAIAAGSALAAFLHWPVATIASEFGALPSMLPLPGVPHLTWVLAVELFPTALVIAFLAGVESLLSAMVADRMTDGQHRPNAELIAQGAANIGSALFAGLPATGAIARTATNISAGAKTPVSGLVHALVIFAVMLVAAPLAGRLAMPALAALLVLTAWNMSEPRKWAAYARTSSADRALLVLTMALTVLADLTVAIGVGVSVGLALRLSRRTTKSDWRPPGR